MKLAGERMKLVLKIMIVFVMFSISASAEPLHNVIVMIADGWGFNQVRADSMWHGSAPPYVSFPVQLAMSTYSWSTLLEDPAGYDSSQAWADFYYMLLRPTDSGAAATAMSTGVKACDGQLGVDPLTGEPLRHVLERAAQLGKATGVITTVEWSHATPAGFVVHNPSRDDYAAIARYMLDSSRCQVIMGCGNPLFDAQGEPTIPESEDDYRYVGGSAEWNALAAGTAGGAEPFTLVQTRASFQALASELTPPRVCGTVQTRETLQQRRDPAEEGNSLTPPYTVPLNPNVPTLAEMTRAALNVLDDDPDGLFLMIEGGAVDWADHSNQLGRCIEELNGYNEVVSAVITWVEAHSNWNETLLIVTGDHETGYLWGPDSGEPAHFNSLVDNGVNHMPDAFYYSESHANSLIPVFAKGMGSEQLDARATRHDAVRGRFLDNTDLAQVIFAVYDSALVGIPPLVTITRADTTIRLRWNATGAATYNIYGDNRPDGNFMEFIGSTTGTVFTVASVNLAQQRHFYVVKAVTP
jgi:alkaline phosphatase